MIQGVYIHIPFCVQKCLYCDFASWSGRGELEEAYVDKLCAEIKERAQENPVAANATIYFGGGTPSLLRLESLKRIIDTLKTYNIWQSPIEVTLELNPGTADLSKMLTYREFGIDRLSIGVQSLCNEELKIIGRIHTAEEALQTIRDAQKVGFKRISADLIRALPGQSLVTYKQSLQRLASTGIEHLSVYDLLVEEDTPLSKLLKSGKLILPEEDEADAMYEVTQPILQQFGLEHYEISNFAMSGQESKHNLVYWHYQPYLALGSSACSFDGKMRRTNAPTIEEYLADKAPLFEKITEQMLLAEYLFMGLRTKRGIDLKKTREIFGVDVWKKYGNELEVFRQGEMLVYAQQEDHIYLTEYGFKFSNQIFEVFL